MTTVTPLSKYLAMVLFILLPLLGFYLGVQYHKVTDSSSIELMSQDEKIQTSNQPLNNQEDESSMSSTFEIHPFARKVRIVSSYKTPARMILTNPDSTRYGPDGLGASNYTVDVDSETYDIKDPVPGTWTVRFVPVGEKSVSSDDVAVAVLTLEAENYYFPPIASIDEKAYEGIIGVPITFSAFSSYAPSSQIVKYEWDYDSNGVYDVTTDVPTTEQTYTESFYGLLTLRVTDDVGNTDMTNTYVIAR